MTADSPRGRLVTDQQRELVARALCSFQRPNGGDWWPLLDELGRRSFLARAEAILRILADAGELVTPEVRDVVEAAREEAQLIRLVAAIVPGSMSRGPRARLLAAVDAHESTVDPADRPDHPQSTA